MGQVWSVARFWPYESWPVVVVLDDESPADHALASAFPNWVQVRFEAPVSAEREARWRAIAQRPVSSNFEVNSNPSVTEVEFVEDSETFHHFLMNVLGRSDTEFSDEAAHFLHGSKICNSVHVAVPAT